MLHFQERYVSHVGSPLRGQPPSYAIVEWRTLLLRPRAYIALLYDQVRGNEQLKIIAMRLYPTMPIVGPKEGGAKYVRKLLMLIFFYGYEDENQRLSRTRAESNSITCLLLSIPALSGRHDHVMEIKSTKHWDGIRLGILAECYMERRSKVCPYEREGEYNMEGWWSRKYVVCSQTLLLLRLNVAAHGATIPGISIARPIIS